MQQFVDAYHKTKAAIDADNQENAAAGYREMHGVYAKIANSDLDIIHKQLAHDQITKVYEALQAPSQGSTRHATTHIVAAAVLLMFFSFLVFFRPSLVGLVTLEQTVSQEVNLAFVESGSRLITLNAVPGSLSLTGKLDGNGAARVFARTEQGRVLVFDSRDARIAQDGTFNNICANSCALSTNSKDVVLDVELSDNAALTIYSVDYGVGVQNTPPAWNGPRTFQLSDRTGSIALSTYFYDPDGDNLNYLATSAKDLTVSVHGNTANLVAANDAYGERTITLIASDGKDVTKVDVSIIF